MKLDKLTDVLEQIFWLSSYITVYHCITYATGFAQVMIIPEWSNDKSIPGPESWCWESCWGPEMPLTFKGNNPICSNLWTYEPWSSALSKKVTTHSKIPYKSFCLNAVPKRKSNWNGNYFRGAIQWPFQFRILKTFHINEGKEVFSWYKLTGNTMGKHSFQNTSWIVYCLQCGHS